MAAHLHNNLFEYTSGRWLFNDDLRHAERRLVFNVDELSRLAAESVSRSSDDILSFDKLAEGGFNRTFLITMRCGFRMVARIPYPIIVPKYLTIASEVATMDYLRSIGLPIPEVYGYSPVPNNPAETEYIFMEFVQGTNLSDIWFDLGEKDIISVARQLVELESKMMAIVFPAGGSLYYTEDLKKATMPGSAFEPTARPAVLLENNSRFSVGPDTSVHLWYGRRAQLDSDRGPYENAEAALTRGAEKELAYLRRFGRPLLPFQRLHRESYKYQKQAPSDHIENLHRYLRIASSLIPKDPDIGRHFCIRHPDLKPSNIIVSRTPDSSLRIASVIDWQHASILPLFLHASIPWELQNHDDITSQYMIPPSPPPPEKLADFTEAQKSNEMERYRRRLVHYHYVKHTEEYNKLHYYAALIHPMAMLRRRVFCRASEPWEGETLKLKVDLIQVTEDWDVLTGSGEGGRGDPPGPLPCPISFDADDVRETMRLDEELRTADNSFEMCERLIGFAGSEGWTPVEFYEMAMALNKKLKADGLASAESEAERDEIATHWPFDDMDEEEYM